MRVSIRMLLERIEKRAELSVHRLMMMILISSRVDNYPLMIPHSIRVITRNRCEQIIVIMTRRRIHDRRSCWSRLRRGEIVEKQHMMVVGIVFLFVFDRRQLGR